MSKIEEALRRMRLTAAAGGASQRAVASLADAAIPAPSAAALVPERSDPVLVDFPKLRAAGYLGEEADAQLLEDQYRVIKRPLVAQAFGRKVVRPEDGNVIQITSALPGEGKSFTCLNLALSLAQEHGITVLLVDGDIVNPRLSSLFGLEQQPGLVDFLADPNGRLEALVRTTSNPQLLILPAGMPRANAAELLSSDRMAAFIAAAGRSYGQQLVLFDSPPVLPTSEARALASWMGQIVVVVRAGVTPQEAVADAVRSLEESKPINLVLNQVSGRSVHGSYGAYGYPRELPSVPQQD